MIDCIFEYMTNNCDVRTLNLKDEDGKEFFGRAYLEVKSSRGVPVYLDVPPQIPVRPISYTPSYPSNSRHNLNKGSCEGLGLVEPTEHSTPDPDPLPMLRRGVAVCSVAPTLPRRLHSNTPSETESIQKPCWDYPYDGERADDWRLGAGNEKTLFCHS